MSFGFSVGDIIAVATLAKDAFIKTKNACGDHEQLTREVQGFYINLELLSIEVSRPESIFNRNDIDDNAPIGTTASKLDFDSYTALLVEISDVLEKYDRLSIENKLGFRKALEMVSFGNWKVQDLEIACQKLYQATQLIQAFILIITAGSMRRIEFQGAKTQEISITTIKEVRKLTQSLEQYMSTQGVQGLGEPTKLLASQSAKSLPENSSAGLSPQLQPADRSFSNKESKSSSALLEPPPRTEYRIGNLSLVIGQSSKPKSKAPTETFSVKDLVRRTSGRRDPWESESEKDSGEENSPKKRGGIFRWTKHTKTAEQDDDDNDDSDPESEVDALFANPAQSHRRRDRHTTKPRNDSLPPPPYFNFHSATDSENEKTKSASKLGRVLGFGRNKNKKDASEDESEPSFVFDSAQDSEDESAKRGGKFGRLFGGRDKHKEKASEDFYPPPRNDPPPPLPGLEDDEDDEEKPARKSRGLFRGRDKQKRRAREDVYRFHNDPPPGFEDEEDKPAKKFGGLFSGRKNKASDDESEPSFVFNSASDSSGRLKKKQGKKIGGFWGRDKKKKKGSDRDSMSSGSG
jgi:hypothetical protein